MGTKRNAGEDGCIRCGLQAKTLAEGDALLACTRSCGNRVSEFSSFRSARRRILAGPLKGVSWRGSASMVAGDTRRVIDTVELEAPQVGGPPPRFRQDPGDRVPRSASAVVTSRARQAITEIKHLSWFLDWLGGTRRASTKGVRSLLADEYFCLGQDMPLGRSGSISTEKRHWENSGRLTGSLSPLPFPMAG